MRWVSFSANQNLRSSSISTNQSSPLIIFSAENISNKMGENESSWWLKLFKDNFKNARATFWSTLYWILIHFSLIHFQQFSCELRVDQFWNEFLKWLSLHGNPWICDCGIKNAVDDLANDQDTVILLKRFVSIFYPENGSILNDKLDQKYFKNRVLGSAGSNHTCDPSGPNAGENIMDATRMKGTG